METETPVAPTYSTITRRFFASVLDGLILMIPCGLAGKAIPVIGGVAVFFLYAPVLESSVIRGTIGKHLLGIQVVNLHGGRITFQAAFVRNLIKLVSSLLLFFGHIFAFFSSRRQALHDMVADTIVLEGAPEGNIADAWLASMRDLFGAGRSGPAAGAPPLDLDAVSQLERLQSLREKGVLTEDEFQEQKRRILAGR